MSRTVMVLATSRVLFEKARANRRLMTGLAILLAAALFVAYTAAIFHAGYTKATDGIEAWKLEYAAEQEAKAEAELEPYTALLDSEADMLARVLYGVKDNSTDDLRTYCWCVLNRVDNRNYPATLSEVISQPGQWMRYSDDNPVVENLYRIAREELDRWHSQRRPVSNEFVFMNWTEKEIVLRDNFRDGSGTHYWRWNS